MKRRFDFYFPWLFSVSDFIASLISLQLANLIFQITGIIEESQSVIFFILSGWWLVVAVARKDYQIGRTEEYDLTLRTFLVTLLWFLIGTIIGWALSDEYKGGWLPIACLGLIMSVLMAAFRVGIHLILRRYRAKGNNYLKAVIVGKGGTSPTLADIFELRKDFGVRFLGYFDDQAVCSQTRGGIAQFFEMAPGMDLDIIYVHEQLEPALVRRIIDFADENYIKVKLIPGGSLQLEKKLSFSRYGNFFVINVNDIPLDSALNSFGKRAFDLMFASLVTIFILSWLIPLVGVLIKLESQGPVFFIQKRNGANNRVFNCIKFRSMTPNDYADTRQAVRGDSRVTKVGGFLRTTSLDEMPQFLNVLAGDMSVVGPRPHTISMNNSFRIQMGRYNSRHKIRPGITGLAQVKGFRGEIENDFQIRSRVRLDFFYIDNWSFLLDINIMLKTLRELLFHRENVY